MLSLHPHFRGCLCHHQAPLPGPGVLGLKLRSTGIRGLLVNVPQSGPQKFHQNRNKKKLIEEIFHFLFGKAHNFFSCFGNVDIKK